jgi:hypothetical protein
MEERGVWKGEERRGERWRSMMWAPDGGERSVSAWVSEATCRADEKNLSLSYVHRCRQDASKRPVILQPGSERRTVVVNLLVVELAPVLLVLGHVVLGIQLRPCGVEGRVMLDGGLEPDLLGPPDDVGEDRHSPLVVVSVAGMHHLRRLHGSHLHTFF